MAIVLSTSASTLTPTSKQKNSLSKLLCNCCINLAYFHLKFVLMYSGFNLFKNADGTNGQLIFKGLFGVIVWTKKPMKFIKDFCPSL